MEAVRFTIINITTISRKAGSLVSWAREELAFWFGLPTAPLAVIIAAVIFNFVFSGFHRSVYKLDIGSLNREAILYTSSFGALIADAQLLNDEEELAANQNPMDMVLIDKSSLLASAAPVKIARRR